MTGTSMATELSAVSSTHPQGFEKMPGQVSSPIGMLNGENGVGKAK